MDSNHRNAFREVIEELNIKSNDITAVKRFGIHPFQSQDGKIKLFCNMYMAEVDLPPEYNFKTDPNII